MDCLAEEMARWIVLREDVRVKKEAGLPKPWTHDPIMRSVRFTNVHREHDRVTKWVAENWRDGYAHNDNLTPALVIARMVNRPETLEQIGFPVEWTREWEEHFLNVIRERQRTGQLTWGNAYMITTCGQRMDKEVYVLNIAQDVAARQGEEFSTLAQMHEWLMRTKGLGNFLAAQIVADLKNTPGHPLTEAEDWWTWCAPGPGSMKGVNYFFKRPPETPFRSGQFVADINKAASVVFPLVGQNGGGLIHMQDFQNCFCEFNKYMRVKNGGRAKNTYPG